MMTRNDIIYLCAFIIYIILCFVRCRCLPWCRRVQAEETNISTEDRKELIKSRLIVKKAEDTSDFSIHHKQQQQKQQQQLEQRHSQSDIDMIPNNANIPTTAAATATTIDTTPSQHATMESQTTNNNDAQVVTTTTTATPTGTSNNISDSLLKNFASSIRASFTTQIPWERRSSNLVDSTKQCPICLDDYHIGDEICSSPNHECPHVFHVACMSEWLLKRNECPLCRADYLRISSEHPEGGDEEEGNGMQNVMTANGTHVRLASVQPHSPQGLQTLQAVAVEL